MLYHISKTSGLKKLKPQVSTHKKPYLYAPVAVQQKAKLLFTTFLFS